jgi:hypothetical protein
MRFRPSDLKLRWCKSLVWSLVSKTEPGFRRAPLDPTPSLLFLNFDPESPDPPHFLLLSVLSISRVQPPLSPPRPPHLSPLPAAGPSARRAALNISLTDVASRSKTGVAARACRWLRGRQVGFGAGSLLVCARRVFDRSFFYVYWQTLLFLVLSQLCMLPCLLKLHGLYRV